MIPKINPLKQVDRVLIGTDKTIAPLRQSIFRRFPMLFTILVTFGVGATFFGIERVFALTPVFNEHPWLTLGLGLFVLMITGKLYAKLG